MTYRATPRTIPMLAVALVVFVLAAHGNARANPFCGGSVWIYPWNVGIDAPLVSPTSADYGMAIFADGKKNVAARVTLITDADAWSVNVPKGSLAADESDMISPPYLVRFERAVQVRYAFVDAVGVDDAALTDCPSVVMPVRPFGSEGTQPQLGHPEELKPLFLQKLPPLTCGSVYEPPSNTESWFVVGNFGNKPRDTVVRVYVDSDGRAAKVEMVTPSGVEGLDANAMGVAQQGKYHPAMFLCTPVVSEILMTYHYRG